MLLLIVKLRQLTDVLPCTNHANMTLVAVPGLESRSVTHHDWKTLLRSSANNMLTRPPYDVPRANFADDHSITILRFLRARFSLGVGLLLIHERKASSSVGQKMWDSRRVGTRQHSKSRSGCSRRTSEG